MKVGLIGLGAMGLPMARSLLRAGHKVIAYNRSREKAEKLRIFEHALIAASPAEAAAADAVITMLADDAAVEEVVFGSAGILDSALPGTIHVSMSTISVALVARLAEAHAQRGQGFVCAPVFGRPEAAEAQKLFIVAAGKPDTIRKCEPLFAAMGQRTFLIGDKPEAASVVKLSGNFLIAATIEAFGEAFALIRKYGVSREDYVEMLTNTLFTAPVHKTYGTLIAKQQFEPAGFKLKLGLKDIRLALAAADSAGVPMPFASIIHDQGLSAIAQGLGEKDWSSIALMAARNAGLD